MFEYKHDAENGIFEMRSNGNVIDLATEVIHVTHSIYENLCKANSGAAEAFKDVITNNIKIAFWDDEKLDGEISDRLEKVSEDKKIAAKKVADATKSMSAKELDELFKEMEAKKKC